MAPPPINTLAFLGGRLCLDFVNTANWGTGAAADDRLVDAGAVAIWLERQGLAQAPRFTGDLTELRRLRLAIRRLFASDAEMTAEDLEILETARAGGAPTLIPVGGAVRLAPELTGVALARLLADSATDLALTGDRARVKTCDGPGCGWVFYDESPNNRRRWCSMSDCGNRAKAKRFYEARRKARPSTG